MDYVEAEGDSIDEAIENALKSLGVTRDKITVDILAEARRGIFGFGSQKARVRASLRKGFYQEAGPVAPESRVGASALAGEEAAAMADKAKTVLSEILRLMAMDASIQIRAEPGGETVLEIQTSNSGLLIGRKGQTLEALQYLITRIVGERQGAEGPQLVIDVENYRERRRKSLEDMALRLGEKAKRQRKTVTIDALSAADRRVIHAALQDDPWLTTKSLGQGAYRRLLIIPEGDRRTRQEDKAGQPDAAARAAHTPAKPTASGRRDPD